MQSILQCGYDYQCLLQEYFFLVKHGIFLSVNGRDDGCVQLVLYRFRHTYYTSGGHELTVCEYRKQSDQICLCYQTCILSIFADTNWLATQLHQVPTRMESLSQVEKKVIQK